MESSEEIITQCETAEAVSLESMTTQNEQEMLAVQVSSQGADVQEDANNSNSELILLTDQGQEIVFFDEENNQLHYVIENIIVSQDVIVEYTENSNVENDITNESEVINSSELLVHTDNHDNDPLQPQLCESEIKDTSSEAMQICSNDEVGEELQSNCQSETVETTEMVIDTCENDKEEIREHNQELCQSKSIDNDSIPGENESESNANFCNNEGIVFKPQALQSKSFVTPSEMLSLYDDCENIELENSSSVSKPRDNVNEHNTTLEEQIISQPEEADIIQDNNILKRDEHLAEAVGVDLIRKIDVINETSKVNVDDVIPAQSPEISEDSGMLENAISKGDHKLDQLCEGYSNQIRNKENGQRSISPLNKCSEHASMLHNHHDVDNVLNALEEIVDKAINISSNVMAVCQGEDAKLGQISPCDNHFNESNSLKISEQTENEIFPNNDAEVVKVKTPPRKSARRGRIKGQKAKNASAGDKCLEDTLALNAGCSNISTEVNNKLLSSKQNSQNESIGVKTKSSTSKVKRVSFACEAKKITYDEEQQVRKSQRIKSKPNLDVLYSEPSTSKDILKSSSVVSKQDAAAERKWQKFLKSSPPKSKCSPTAQKRKIRAKVKKQWNSLEAHHEQGPSMQTQQTSAAESVSNCVVDRLDALFEARKRISVDLFGPMHRYLPRPYHCLKCQYRTIRIENFIRHEKECGTESTELNAPSVSKTSRDIQADFNRFGEF